jgi:hypothetical protein
MSVEITIWVPDDLGRRLERFRDRLPEVLERGLRDLQTESESTLEDENAIVALLASRPTPEQVLGIRPSSTMQERVSDLLARGKEGELSRSEDAELDRYLFVEHLVRLAKAHALEELANKE